MLERLPHVLSPVDLPVAELYAARLDGELFPVGGAFSPVDEIEQPELRAAAVHAEVSGRLIAEQLSAAWIWGALDSPPLRHQFCVGAAARVSHSPARWMTLREVIIEEDEISDLGGFLVTTPERTVIDLVRFSESFGPTERTIIRALARGGASLEAAADNVRRRRNLPNKRRALARLASALPPAELPAAE